MPRTQVIVKCEDCGEELYRTVDLGDSSRLVIYISPHTCNGLSGAGQPKEE